MGENAALEKNQTSEELMFGELNKVALGLNIKPSE